jgi:hypothetical protein
MVSRALGRIVGFDPEIEVYRMDSVQSEDVWTSSISGSFNVAVGGLCEELYVPECQKVTV